MGDFHYTFSVYDDIHFWDRLVYLLPHCKMLPKRSENKLPEHPEHIPLNGV